MKPAIQFHIVLRLRMSGAIFLLPVRNWMFFGGLFKYFCTGGCVEDVLNMLRP